MGWPECHTLRSIVQRKTREASRPDHESAELRTRFLAASLPHAWRQVLAAVERVGACRQGWRIEDESPATGQVLLVRRRLLRWCVSDVTVALSRAEGGAGPLVAIDVSSVSRGGPVDFGQNARNIRDFYRALEATLQAVHRVSPSNAPAADAAPTREDTDAVHKTIRRDSPVRPDGLRDHNQ